jgi:hypothetical protein
VKFLHSSDGISVLQGCQNKVAVLLFLLSKRQ